MTELMIDWINPVATLVASFAGAWAAFKFQAVEKARDTNRANVSAANRTLMIMMQQANTLKLYQQDQIDPSRNNPGRHLAIRPTLPFELESLRFDFKSLDFFSSPKEQQLLFELSVEERRFIEALSAINARSELLLTQVQPRLAAAGFLDSGSYDGEHFIQALGQPLYNALKRLTDDVIYHVDRTNGSIVEMKDRFLAAAKARYSRATFVDFDFPNAPPAAP